MNESKKHTHLPCSKIDFSFKRPSPSQATVPTANIFSCREQIIGCPIKEKGDDEVSN